ncbi:MAG: flotillin-like protein FloA [Thermoguttaceae bacterium]|nr:flotillin-like protein FloA [Thermoguttaceae bacterium]MDW8078950.1 flotillin-like protein FloA [Thermoguttaceae bacterium]
MNDWWSQVGEVTKHVSDWITQIAGALRENPLWTQVGTVLLIVFAIFALVVLVIMVLGIAFFFRLWIQAKTTRAGISIWDLIGMTLRHVDPEVIVRSKIMAVQAGLDPREITTRALESHYLAGGNVPQVIRALIAAHKAGSIPLNWRLATAIDLAGRDVLEAVQMSVTPKVIDCPRPGSGRDSLDGVAKNGIQLKVKARVTVRANLERLIGGATEETIIARVGEGIVSAIGSAETHQDVLANPELISKTVLQRRLDANTAFEIVSIDIADIDVGENIGARLQADQAEADMEVARAEAEGRRAMAKAKEQEYRALIEQNRARLVEAEAEVFRAMAEAFRTGKLGVVDYYKLRNLQADTEMRLAVATAGLGHRPESQPSATSPEVSS